jgi:hypothetical protein
MEMKKEKWWYFIKNDDDTLTLAPKEMFKSRPKDANPDNGNSYTPWYQLKNHLDEYHVHIKATTKEEALSIALQMTGS